MRKTRKQEKRAKRKLAKLAKLVKIAKTAESPLERAKTQGGRDIQRLLVSARKNPRAYKDWCIMSHGCLIDWQGSYAMSVTTGRVEGVLLIHKSRLHERYPVDFSETLWNRTLNLRRVKKS